VIRQKVYFEILCFLLTLSSPESKKWCLQNVFMYVGGARAQTVRSISDAEFETGPEVKLNLPLHGK